MRLRSLIASILIVAASTMPLAGALHAVDTPQSSDAPDLTAVREKIKAKDFKAAVTELLGMTENVQHADVYNLLAFSLRNLGDYDGAAKWYREALYYDPDHKAALEYQGEMFIKLGNLSRARENLTRLQLLCPNGCEELEGLQSAMDGTAVKPRW